MLSCCTGHSCLPATMEAGLVFFFSPFNFEDYRIYTYSGKIFCSTAMKEQSGGNTHIMKAVAL